MSALKGTTKAMHTTVGFGLAALGSWGGGIVLDLARGPDAGSGWFAVFAFWRAQSCWAVSLRGGQDPPPACIWWHLRAGVALAYPIDDLCGARPCAAAAN